MNKRIDFSKLEGLAVYQDTLDFLQTSYRGAFEAIAKAFGPYVIVTGVTDEGASYSDGWVVIDGELMPFVGGLKDDLIVVEELTDTEVFGDDSVQTVYYTKRAKCGNVDGVDFDDFVRLNTLANLQTSLTALIATVAGLATVPVGTIVMWSGAIVDIPGGWALCDGSGSTPDLRGKFIVGYNSGDIDYNAIGKTGGEKKHALTANENGPHTHTYKDRYQLQAGGPGDPAPGTATEIAVGGTYSGSEGNDNNNTHFWYTNETTGSSGLGTSHENRPPYYTLAYIIKL